MHLFISLNEICHNYIYLILVLISYHPKHIYNDIATIIIAYYLMVDDDGNGDCHEDCDHDDHNDGDNQMTLIVIYVSLLLLMTSKARTVWYLHTKPVLSSKYKCPYIYITVMAGFSYLPAILFGGGGGGHSHKLMYIIHLNIKGTMMMQNTRTTSVIVCCPCYGT